MLKAMAAAALALVVAWAGLSTRLTAAVQFGYVHVFMPALGAPDGIFPMGPMVEANDGWVYGLTWQYGETCCDSSTGYGSLFRFDPSDPAGTYAVIFNLFDFAVQNSGVFHGPNVGDGGLVEGPDGNLYFTTQGTCSSGVFQVVPSETPAVSLLHNFGCGGLDGVMAGLAVGPDGALYAPVVDPRVAPPVGGIMRVALDGTASQVASFPAGFELTNNQTAFTALTAGSDGWLYGGLGNLGSNGISRLYRADPSTGIVELVYEFPVIGPNGEPYPMGRGPIGRLLEIPGVSGGVAWMGVTAEGGHALANGQQFGTVYRLEMSPAPALTKLYEFNPSNAFTGIVPRSGLVQAPDGTVYGTTSDAANRDADTAGGTVYRLDGNGQPVLVAGGGTMYVRPWAPILVADNGDLYGSSFSEDPFWAAPGLGRLFRISKADQAPLTVTGAPASAAYGTSFSVGTSGGSGTGAVTFSATGACSTDGSSTITMISGVGDCIITATKAGDDDYQPITSGPVTVAATTADQLPIAVIGAPPSAAYGTSFSVGISGGSGTGPVTFAVIGACTNVNGGSLVTMASGTGDCSIVATSHGDVNYNDAVSPPVVVAATVASQAPLAITGAPATAADGSSFLVGITGGSGTGTVSFATSGACSNNGVVITMTQSAGVCSITATKAGDGNYASAISPEVGVSATVAQPYQFVEEHRFLDPPGPLPDGMFPAGPLVQAGDGWVYGLTQQHGSTCCDSSTQYGALFRFDPADPGGTYEVIFKLFEFAEQHVGTFVGGAVGDGGLVEAPDGNLYFTTLGVCGHSGVFRVVPSAAPADAVSLLHNFGCGGMDSAVAGPTVGADGALYVPVVDPHVVPNVGGIVRVALDGTATQVASFPAGFAPHWQSSFTALTAGSDGWLYGGQSNPGVNSASRLYRAHPTMGVVESVYEFPVTGPNGEAYPMGRRPIGRLLEIPGLSGGVAWMGVTSEGGVQSQAGQLGRGTFFRLEMSPAPAFTKLYDFDPFQPFTGHNPRSGLVRAPDGTVYGTTSDAANRDADTAGGTVYRLDGNGLPELVAGGGTMYVRPWAPILVADNGDLYGSSFSEDPSWVAPGHGRIFRLTRGKLNQAPLVLTAPVTATYQEEFAVSTSGGSGTGAVTIAVNGVCTTDGISSITMTGGTGTCIVTATKAGDQTYNPASSSPATVTAVQAAATITLSDLIQSFDGTPKAVTVTTTPAGLAGVAVTYDGSPAPPSAAGSYAVLATLTHADYQAPDASGTLTITAVAPKSLKLTPSSVTGGVEVDGKIMLTGKAPAGGAAIALSSSDASVASVAAFVIVPEGANSAAFTIATAGVDASRTIEISASYGSTLVESLIVAPPTLSAVTLDPSRVQGGQASTGTITLTGPAGPAGVVVSLSSADPSVATVPGSVVIPAGATTVQFPIATSVVNSGMRVTITATIGADSKSATLTVQR